MEEVLALVASQHLGSDHYSRVTTQVCIGENTLVLKLPHSPGGGLVNLFQCVVVSLKDLSVHENIVTRITHTPPSGLQPYVGKSEFLLLLTTCKMQRDFLPNGAFLELLEKVGAGEKLQRMIDIVSHMDDRQMPPPLPGKPDPATRGYSYILVATMSVDDGRGLEAASLTDSQVLDFRFQWNDVSKQYMPVGYSGPFVEPE